MKIYYRTILFKKNKHKIMINKHCCHLLEAHYANTQYQVKANRLKLLGEKVFICNSLSKNSLFKKGKKECKKLAL